MLYLMGTVLILLLLADQMRRMNKRMSCPQCRHMNALHAPEGCTAGAIPTGRACGCKER